MMDWPTWLIERFWSRVDPPAPSGIEGCWPWSGCRDRYGYGRFRCHGIKLDIKAHRVAYWLTHGTLPELVRHTCDNPWCVRPDHLLPGDHRSNAADAIERGRWPVRPRRFTDDQELAIRAQYARGGCTYRSLAHEHGASFGLIQNIMRRG